MRSVKKYYYIYIYIYIYIYRKRANKKMGIKFDSKKDLRIMKLKKIHKNK